MVWSMAAWDVVNGGKGCGQWRHGLVGQMEQSSIQQNEVE